MFFSFHYAFLLFRFLTMLVNGGVSGDGLEVRKEEKEKQKEKGKEKRSGLSGRHEEHCEGKEN